MIGRALASIAMALAACTNLALATESSLAPGDLAALTGGGADIIIRRAAVPATGDPHGEVRLIRRDHSIVMQTLLESRVLKRVVREIALKEDRGWPEGSALRDQSRRYVEALEAAAQAVFLEHARRPQLRSERQRLLIEFVLAPHAAVVTLYELPAGTIADRDRLPDKKLVRLLEPPRAYVERNVLLIAQDSLGLSAEDVERAVAAPP